jgi:dihydroflavonol-4-reductase
MTSSISAIIFGRGVREKLFAEADWTDKRNRDDTSPYDRAKTIAERAAWAWHKAEAGGSNSSPSTPAWFSGQIPRSRFSVVRAVCDCELGSTAMHISGSNPSFSASS